MPSKAVIFQGVKHHGRKLLKNIWIFILKELKAEKKRWKKTSKRKYKTKKELNK